MRKTTMAALLVAGLTLWQTPPAEAAIKLHGLFTDNMVLQRDQELPIWGTADPGQEVKVRINRPDKYGPILIAVKADKDGKWVATFPALRTGGPYTLKVGDDIELKNVMVGEVWIASGQSNMEWELMKTRDPEKVIASSKNPRIRLFDVPKTPQATAQKELGSTPPSKTRTFGKWLECGPDTVPGFSAVACYFGRSLEKNLEVPIGIINSSWGGTAAERWVSKTTLDAFPELVKSKGASNLYNGMIAPLAPFAFRGVIWYQGESNAGRHQQYFHLMNALIKNWRDDWKQGDFPFLTVQLAPYDNIKVPEQWAELREAQLMTSLKVKNTAMAVITDVGDPKNIHPVDKEPVGERLALAARAIAYKQKVEYIGPLYDGVAFKNGQAVLTFQHVGGGLVAKGGPLTGFTIAGKDGKFVKAEATIVGSTVVVRSQDVAAPAAVRYGWANYPIVNLVSREGLPATPFRTDAPDYGK